MSRVRVHNLSVSLDGFVAGPRQTLEDPLGVGGERLHDWMWETAYGKYGRPGGTTGVDDAWLRRGDEGVGAHVMGRNMFGPVRGPWPDGSWHGWWGEDPPYHHDVFVLTHHARDPLPMTGGTTFHFVTDGLHAAVERALVAADGADVRIGGGAATVRAALQAGLVDELDVAIVPVVLGSGEPLWSGFPERYRCADMVGGEGAAHLRFVRR
jgi:dihydrofolate reductase